MFDVVDAANVTSTVSPTIAADALAGALGAEIPRFAAVNVLVETVPLASVT